MSWRKEKRRNRVTRLVASHVSRRGNRRVVDGWRRRGRGRGGRGRGRETHLRDADELSHVPHALRARLSSLPEEFSEGRGVQRRAAVGTPRFLVLAQRVQEHLLRAVAVEAVPARVEFQDDVRPRAREWQWLKAERAHVWSVDAGARPAARHGCRTFRGQKLAFRRWVGQPYLLPSTVPTASRLLCRDAFSRASGERGALDARPRESSTDVASRPRCRPSTRPRVAVRG